MLPEESFITVIKLLNSKWTAVQPQNKEKHFIVTKVFHNEMDPQIIDDVIIEAVFTRKEYRVKASELRVTDNWIKGWN